MPHFVPLPLGALAGTSSRLLPLRSLLRGLRTKSSSLSEGPHGDNGNLPALSPRRAGVGTRQTRRAASLPGSWEKGAGPPGATPDPSARGADAASWGGAAQCPRRSGTEPPGRLRVRDDRSRKQKDSRGRGGPTHRWRSPQLLGPSVARGASPSSVQGGERTGLGAALHPAMADGWRPRSSGEQPWVSPWLPSRSRGTWPRCPLPLLLPPRFLPPPASQASGETDQGRLNLA